MKSPLLDLSTIPPYAGATNPAFLFPDYLTLAEVQADAREPLSEAKRHRLVKGSKCPTAIKPANFKPESSQSWLVGADHGTLIEPQKQKITPEGQRAAYAVFQFRDWSDEYRVMTRVETTTGMTPPEQCGPRISETLTPRAARKVAESCSYVALKKGGYRTFFTLTFDDDRRAAIAAGDTSIQKEVSRFMDGLQKMWRRGWTAEFTVNGRKMFCADNNGLPQGEPAKYKPCHNQDCKRCIGLENKKSKLLDVCQTCQKTELLYVWVAEAPDNDKGEQNPHVHVLINWRVKFALFPAWAKRIESLWGQGMAHLEKIKDSDAAASYMMKAAGYLCKAQGKNDQGTIRGNRYGISAAARAPAWATLGEKQLHIMGRLIADVHDHLTVKYGELYNRRRALKTKMDAIPKGQKARHIIGRQLQTVREKIAALPIVASKYQVLLKGKNAFYEFMNWAKSPQWSAAACPWLPEKGPGEAYREGERPDSQWFAEFKDRHYYRRALRRIPVFSDLEFQQAANDYEVFAALAV